MRFWLFAFYASSIFSIVSCGSDGGDNTPPLTSTINVEGVWTITETNIEDCPGWELEQYDLWLIQDGNNIFIEDGEGNVFDDGYLNGFKLSWSGSYSELSSGDTPGITTINLSTTTINPSCNSLKGAASWTWNATDLSGETCSGTTSFTGTRAPASGCGFNVPPVAPTELSATATSTDSISLSWSDKSSNETNFIVESSTSSGTGYSNIATLSADVTSYEHTGLSSSTTYFYRVYASNDIDNSNYSNEAYATTHDESITVPTAPSNLTATAISSTSISLDWTVTSDNEDGFIIFIKEAIMQDYREAGRVEQGVNSYIIESLTPGRIYQIYVVAFNDAGLSSEVSTSILTPP